jgi:hypothetical protein
MVVFASQTLFYGCCVADLVVVGGAVGDGAAWWTCCWLCGGLGIRVYRVVLASVDLVLVAADPIMVTVWICHSGGVCRRGDEFTELRFGVAVRVGAAEEVGDNGCFDDDSLRWR